MKSTQSRRKLRSCTLMIVTHMCTGAQSCESVHIALGSNPHPHEAPAASLPRSEGAGTGAESVKSGGKGSLGSGKLINYTVIMQGEISM